MDIIRKITGRKYLLLAVVIIASFLRLSRIDQVPVSLFGDELDVGYHAYSILKTGRDYSRNRWPLHFQSLAEWRTPLYIYSAVPTVALFGISPLGVRLPAAIFGILGVWATYLLVNKLLSCEVTKSTNNKSQVTGVVAALIMALSPWHIQYSRAGFEVTLLILLLLLGLYCFFSSLKSGKWLWISAAFFALTPWVYSTAKLFTPLLLVFLIIVWLRELLQVKRQYLLFAGVALLVVGTPIAYSTIYSGGAQRFGYISVFTDPTTEPEVGSARLVDARVRGEKGEGLTPNLLDRIIHNKFTFWGTGILKNYFESFSTEFLFIKGDLNLRHSIGIGELFRVEAITLILGLIFFFTEFGDKRVKALILFWILVGVVPAAITREGGKHATRLILILPPLVFLISYGLTRGVDFLKPTFKKIAYLLYCGIWILSFGFYLHRYWVHYPWESERWWHAGFKEAIEGIKDVEKDYDRIVISTANEPPWIFFAALWQYPPDKWQKEFPIGNDVDLPGFGRISHTDKFYFGTAQTKAGIYGLGQILDSQTLYLATEKEIGLNLILEPERVPDDINLIKAISFPSGEPVFYLLSKRS